MKGAVHLCSFETADHLRGKKRTYAAVKAAVLEAGRFSVFEATATPRDARLFTRLCKDPEIEVVEMWFPWTGIRLKVKP